MVASHTITPVILCGGAGSRLIALAGVPFGTPGSTNLIHVVTLSGTELKAPAK